MDQRFLLGGGGSSGAPPKPAPKVLEEELDEDVIFLPPPPGILIAKVSPSLRLKSFLGPEGRCGEGPSSMSAPSSVSGLVPRLAAAF